MKKYKAIDIGLLDAKEYRNRRSKNLQHNPEAELIESEEINLYLKSLSPKYQDEIYKLSDLKNNPMKPLCRMIITLASFGEESRIRHTLKQYVGQMNPEKFEIIVFDNHPKSIARDKTYEEVLAFKKDHPKISIIYAHKIWKKKDPCTVGNARKHVFDMALTRINNRKPVKFETVILSNDADIICLDKDYLKKILDTFDKNKELDALVTALKLPKEVISKPNMYSIITFWDTFARTIALDDGGSDILPNPKPAHLIGRSSAFRASICAAVGSFNQRNEIIDDVEIGWMIADSRDWDPKRIIHFDEVFQVTDPRRHLVAMANRVPLNEMYSDFQQTPEIRQSDNNELLRRIPDELDWELFQDDVDNFWQGKDTGLYRSLGNRMEFLFKSTMNKIGVKFKIVNDRVVIQDASVLLKNFRKFSRKSKRIKIIHSKQRDSILNTNYKIKNFFFSVSKAYLESRNIRSKEIFREMEKAKKNRDEIAYKHYAEKYRRFIDL